MAIMMGKLYQALRAANVPDSEAIAAAEEVAAHETRLSGFEIDLSAIKGDLNLLKWMVATTLAGVIAILVKLFIH
jgi:hypothetical protein